MDSTGESISQASSLTDEEKKLPPPALNPSSRRSLPSPSPPFLNKFATIATDKYTQNLRRDLLLSNFDRNLTVEQAHFDPNLSLGVPQDNLPTAGNPSGSGALYSHTVNNNDNSSSNNTNNNTDLNYHHLNNDSNSSTNFYPPNPDSVSVNAHSPPLGPMLTPPAEPHYLSRRTSNSKLDTKRKQAKRSPMHSTATPSEYFHRNLVDAVSNVEDSDENEYYVYPYSGNEHSASDYYSTSAPRSPAGRPKKSNTVPLRSSLSSHELKDTATTKPRRPKLRSYVMDPHSAKKEYGSMMGSQSRLGDGQLLRNSTKRNPSKRYLPTYQQATDGYASDDEGENLVWKDNRRKPRRHRCLPLWVICGSVSLFFLLCFMALLYGGAQPLQQVTISMGRVLASDKELIFDLHVTAYNPNGWTVHVADAEMSVFAFSRIVPLDLSNETSSNFSYTGRYHEVEGVIRLKQNSKLCIFYFLGADPAEYLGSFYHFDEPLAFSSSIFSCKPTQAVSQIRIKSPGDDESGNERWSRMIRYPYGLLARGVLSYHSLGLPGVQTQSVTICNVAKVDPITGVVSGDPDQGFCSTSSHK
ncbi:unnamed protein product [Absidia cylindrospora]